MIKCDGNHGGPRCQDPECWNDSKTDLFAPVESITLEAMQTCFELSKASDNWLCNDDTQLGVEFALEHVKPVFLSAIELRDAVIAEQQQDRIKWKVKAEEACTEASGLRHKVADLTEQNLLLKHGLKGDFDLDAWLEFATDKATLVAAISEWQGLAEKRAQMIIARNNDIEILRALSVNNIMLTIAPGLDGMGVEIYAQSVAHVKQKLCEMGDNIELLTGENGQLQADLERLKNTVLLIADDYYPDTEADAALALGEMREALKALELVKCRDCDDHGVIGYTIGQTAESFDQGEYPCPACSPVEYAEEVAELRTRIAGYEAAVTAEIDHDTLKHSNEATKKLLGGFDTTSIFLHDCGTLIGRLIEQVARLAVKGDTLQANLAAMREDRDSHQRCAIQAMTKLTKLREQKPVHWRAVLSPEEVPQQLNHHMHVVGFTERSKAEDWVAAHKDIHGWTYALDDLYAEPLVIDKAVALVLPERKPANFHWNECLEEVKRLNPFAADVAQGGEVERLLARVTQLEAEAIYTAAGVADDLEIIATQTARAEAAERVLREARAILQKVEQTPLDDWYRSGLHSEVWNFLSVTPARPVAADVAGDGMCNADDPSKRCVCREEFGSRVCVPDAQPVAADVVQVTAAQIETWADKLNSSDSNGYGWEYNMATELRALLATRQDGAKP